MIRPITYSFSELTIDKVNLSAMLGFPEGNLPEPFDLYVAEAFQEAEMICDIQGAYCFTKTIEFGAGNGQLIVDGLEFEIGKTIAKELRHSENLALFICTAGSRISQLSQELLTGENPVLGYIYDVLGSMIAEAATDKLQLEIQKIANEQGSAITNRYSPGYCKWSVADQHKLFSFFPENCCKISLSESALMYPIKSVSGIIGVGANVKFREYTCDLCNQNECFQRSHRRIKA